tara:strand:- start:29 stop:316 length:288 start_codon:yes stop_codon:yes gene_type:complete
LSKPNLIKQLKIKNSKINQSDLESIIEIFCESIRLSLAAKKIIEIRGFGTFFVKKLKENFTARNPKTGELIYVPEKNKVRFRPSKKLKKIINEKT